VQHHHHEINNAYHFQRINHGDSVHVFNADHYLMAVYDTGTGRASWQRVVAATQRESVEKWLRENYPMTRSAAANLSKQAAKKLLKK
jgi:hypothetical protein